MSQLTEEQLQIRKGFLTASDCAAVLGLDPYRNAADVWAEKSCEHDDRFDRHIPDAVQIGSDLEEWLIKWGAEETGHQVHKFNVWRPHENGILGATLDAIGSPIGATDHVAFEAKTTGLCADERFIDGIDDWGPDMSDEIPPRILPQVFIQQACCPEVAYTIVPAMVGGRGRVIYRVQRDEDAIATVVEQCTAWWNKHVVAGEPPADCQPSLDTAKLLHRPPDGPTIDIEPSLLLKYLECVNARKTAKDAEDEIKAQLMAICGDTYEGVYADGVGTLRFRTESAGMRISNTELRRQFPDAWHALAYEATRVMPRFKADD